MYSLEQKYLMKRIIVVGGGFGGYNVLKTLFKEKIAEKNEVILVDKSRRFVYLPSLPYLLSGKKQVDDITASLTEVAKRLDATFVNSELEEVLLSQDKIRLSSGELLEYDFLVLATGATTEYYGIPGAEYTLPSWRLHHYERIIEKINTKRPQRVCIVGAGLTGVEVAGELAEKLGEGVVTVVEKMPIVLPNLKNEKASEEAESILKKHGVDVLKGRGVVKVGEGRLYLEGDKEIECDMIIWSVGIRAPRIKFDQKVPVRGRGWIVVKKNLQVEGYDNVFAVGDINCFSTNGAYAMKMAEEAILQGKVASRNIARMIRGEKPSITHQPIFLDTRPRTLVSLGHNIALLVWNGKVVAGSMPFMGKMLIERMVMRDVKGEFLGDVLTSLESNILKAMAS